MKSLSVVTTLLALAALPGVASAAEADAGVTKLQFSTSAQVHGTPTRLTIHLSAHAQNASASQAQAALNRAMADAVKLASGHDGITVRAGAYTMFRDQPDHAPQRWNAAQDMTLDGTDSVTLLNIAGRLQQQGLTLDNMDWLLDPATRETLMQQARREALGKVNAEARADAEALGLHVAGLEDVRVNMAAQMPRPMMEANARMFSAVAAPQSAPDDQSISATVFVAARLRP